MIDSSVVAPATFNNLHNNEFKTREDVVAACHAMFEPLLPHFSPGKARVQLDATTSTWDRAACDLEGWARPLFGIIPLAAGGEDFPHWDTYRQGLTNGTDPDHGEFWGYVDDMDQRHVEATAIGLALLIVPEHIWEPLDEQAKRNVVAWLKTSSESRHALNNHMFFRVFVHLGLQNVGIAVDESLTEDYLLRLENLYIGDGWYRDGNGAGDSRRIDYYNAFAMHFYGLIYAKYRPQDERRAKLFKERAADFAQHFQHWFSDTGANVPFGRSLVYRHCVVAFWGALALLDIEALPWGVIKGLYLRNLRWWATQPICRSNDGLLSIGYSYPNQYMAERYSASGSPWWSMKAFASLAVPASHPFWAAEELPCSGRASINASPVSGMVFVHEPGHTVLLASGPETGQQMRGVPEKYLKFAYSSRFGFSVESDPLGFTTGAFDSILALSDDGRHYRVREHCESVSIAGSTQLYSLWHPWADTRVETWIISQSPWHIRVHRISSPRALKTVEGGFAAPRTDLKKDVIEVDGTKASVTSTLGDFSGIVDGSSPQRTARIMAPHGNTNVMFPRTLVPQLVGEVAANTVTVFACAVLADPNHDAVQAAWRKPPAMPSAHECEEFFAKHGAPVEVVHGKAVATVTET